MGEDSRFLFERDLDFCGSFAYNFYVKFLIKAKAFEKAIEAFLDAISLAPDFLDAQNNLGTAYGMNNQHQKAYEAFKKAYEMKKDYPNALHGLIVAETNLGMKEAAL